MTPTRALALAALLCAGGVGCGDGHGPDAVAGTFALTTANASALPVLVGATATCDQYLDAADLVLAEDGTFLLTSQGRLDCTATGGGVTPWPLSAAGTYTRAGRTLTLTVPGAFTTTGSYNGDSWTGTIPASGATFPVSLDAVFTRRPRL